MTTTKIVLRKFAGWLVVPVVAGCSEPEEPPPDSLGAFPDGPVVTQVGQRFEYRNERSYAPAGSTVPDSIHRGQTTVSIDSLVPFGTWPLAYRISRLEIWVNSDETRVDSTRSVSWRIFDFDGDTAAVILEVGGGPMGLVTEHAEPRPLIRFPIPEGEDSLSTWGESGIVVSRWSRGRDDVEVDFDVTGDESVAGPYEAYRIDQQYLTGSPVDVTFQEWWGSIGVVREEFRRESDTSIVTTWELNRYTPVE